MLHTNITWLCNIFHAWSILSISWAVPPSRMEMDIAHHMSSCQPHVFTPTYGHSLHHTWRWIMPITWACIHFRTLTYDTHIFIKHHAITQVLIKHHTANYHTQFQTFNHGYPITFRIASHARHMQRERSLHKKLQISKSFLIDGSLSINSNINFLSIIPN